MKLLKWLEGKKTYLVSGLSVLDGLVQLLANGHWSRAIPFLFAGAFGAALRSAVAKLEAKLPAPVAAVVDPIVADIENGAPVKDDVVKAVSSAAQQIVVDKLENK